MAKADAKKKPVSSSSDSDTSSDEEIAVKKTPAASPSKTPAVSSQTSAKSSAVTKVVATPKPSVTPKASANIPAKTVPASKFPKRKVSSSSSDSESSSDESPAPLNKNKKQAVETPKQPPVTPKVNNQATAGSALNNRANNAKLPVAKPAAQTNRIQAAAAKNTPVITSPRNAPPSPAKSYQSQSQQTIGSVTSPPVYSSPQRQQGNQSAFTTSGDEPYSRIEPKKSVTNSFDSNCPHCGKEIEVKLKFS